MLHLPMVSEYRLTMHKDTNTMASEYRLTMHKDKNNVNVGYRPYDIKQGNKLRVRMQLFLSSNTRKYLLFFVIHRMNNHL